MPDNEIQNSFLDRLVKKGAVNIFLKNGIKLQGQITAFDESVVLLTGQTGEQMIFKHAISTVVPDSHDTMMG